MCGVCICVCNWWRLKRLGRILDLRKSDERKEWPSICSRGTATFFLSHDKSYVWMTFALRPVPMGSCILHTIVYTSHKKWRNKLLQLLTQCVRVCDGENIIISPGNWLVGKAKWDDYSIMSMCFRSYFLLLIEIALTSVQFVCVCVCSMPFHYKHNMELNGAGHFLVIATRTISPLRYCGISIPLYH